MKKSIAIMQPVYLPWLGYFEQMALCDEFIFLDDVQYTKQDWRNRNRIRTQQGWIWLTVPVKKCSHLSLLNTIQIQYMQNWQHKHLVALEINYKPCPFYKEIFEIISDAFSAKPERLTNLTIPLIKAFADYMDIKPLYSQSSDLSVKSDDKQGRVIELCNLRGADVFYTGPSAQDYIDEAVFAAGGVKPVFQDYQHPVYEQHFKGFESHMSIIDLLMNYGPRAKEILLSFPKPDFGK